MRLLNCVVRNHKKLPQPVFIQYGSADLELRDCQGTKFLGMEQFEQRVKEASLLVMHAGAGSVIHAIRASRVPVVMARRVENNEHVDNHQVEFARQLEMTGKIVVCRRPDEFPDDLTKAIRLQTKLNSESQRPQIVEMVHFAITKHLNVTQ